MTLEQQNHTMRRGDSRKFTFNVRYLDGRSLVGSSWLWEVRLKRTSTGSALISKTSSGGGGIVLDAAAGTVTVTVLPADTSGIASADLPGKYIHELQGTDTDTNVDTFAEGSFLIVTDIAHA